MFSKFSHWYNQCIDILTEKAQYKYGILLCYAIVPIAILTIDLVVGSIIFFFLFVPFALRLPKKSRMYCLVASICFSMYTIAQHNPRIQRAPQTLKINGVITSLGIKNNKTYITVQSDNNLVLLKIDSKYTVSNVGDSIKTIARQIPIPEPSNPGQFDYKKYLQSKHIIGLYSVDLASIIITKNKTIKQTFYVIRTAIQKKINTTFDESSASLLSTLILGNKNNLDQSVILSFRDTGLYHVLALSGLHIGVFAVIVNVLLTIIRIPSKLVHVGTLIILVGFGMVVQWPPSVQRAVCMYCVIVLTKLFNRKPCTYNTLCNTVSFIIILEPSIISDIGFMLSGSATFFIIYYSALSRKVFSDGFISNFILKPIAITLFASIGTIPILIHFFNSFSPISLLGNIVVVPSIAMTLISGITTLLVGVFSDYLMLVLAEATNTLALCTTTIVEYIYLLSPHPLYLSQWSTLSYGVFILIGLLIPQLKNRSTIRPLILSLATIAAIQFCFNELQSLMTNRIELTMIDVGTGESILLEFPNNKIILIDCGNDLSKAAKYSVIPVLKHKGINHLDMVIISHSHRDHYGGLKELLKTVSIGKVGYSKNSHLPIVKLLQRNKKMSNSNHQVPLTSGDELKGLGNVSLKIIHPNENRYSNENNNSLVMLMTYGTQKMLFTGDIEKKVEESLVKQNLLSDIDILKVAHHGSRTSSIHSFINRTQPEIALISSGAKKKYNHPHKDIVQSFIEKNIKMYVTRVSGALTIYISPKCNKVHTYK